MKTKVIFRAFPSGETIALFPMEIADFNGNILSYLHVGQHGAACPSLVLTLDVPSKSEAVKLFKELEGLGYDLEDLTYGIERGIK